MSLKAHFAEACNIHIRTDLTSVDYIDRSHRPIALHCSVMKNISHDLYCGQLLLLWCLILFSFQPRVVLSIWSTIAVNVSVHCCVWGNIGRFWKIVLFSVPVATSFDVWTTWSCCVGNVRWNVARRVILIGHWGNGEGRHQKNTSFSFLKRRYCGSWGGWALY